MNELLLATVLVLLLLKVAKNILITQNYLIRYEREHQKWLRGDRTMTQLTDEHFELHDKNKAEMYERKKFKFLEDRIALLEKICWKAMQIN